MKGDREVNERWKVKGRYKRAHGQLRRQGREEEWRQRKGKQVKKTGEAENMLVVIEKVEEKIMKLE